MPKEQAIRCMLQEVFAIDNPHQYQLEGVSYLSVDDKGDDTQPARSLLVVQKTSYENSFIVLGSAMLRKKVTVCVVPLIAIGAIQAQKARTNCKSKKMVALHLDNISGTHFREFKATMDEWTSESLNRLSVILYCSPQTMQPGMPWYQVIFGPKGLASKQLISLFAFDETKYPYIPSDGHVLPREFASLKENVVAKLRSARRDVMPPMVAVTASTPTQDSRRVELEQMLGVTFTKTVWSPMDKEM